MQKQSPKNYLLILRLGKDKAPARDIGMRVRDASKKRFETILGNIQDLKFWYVFRSGYGETLLYLVDSPFGAKDLLDLILQPTSFARCRKNEDLQCMPMISWDDAVVIVETGQDCAGHRQKVENGYNLMKLLDTAMAD